MNLILSLAWAALAVSSAALSPAAFAAPSSVKDAAPLPVASKAASKEDIEALIKKIEDPRSRSGLLSELRLLLQALEKKKAAEPATSVNHVYAGFVRRIDDALVQSFRAFSRLPLKFREMSDRWGALYGEGSGLWRLARFLLAIALALLFLVGVRRGINRLLPPPDASEDPSLGEKIGAAIRLWFERALPPGVLLFGGSLLVLLFGLGRIEEGLLLILLWSLFLDRAIVGAIRAFLAPVRPQLRIFPLSNEVAGNVSVWGRRFVIVGVWGDAAARAADVLTLGPDAVAALTNIYRFIVLLLALSLILQYRGGVRRLLSTPEPDDAGRSVRSAVAMWNILAARWHFIALPYLIVLFALWSAESKEGFKFLLSATGQTALILAAAYALVRLVRLGAARLFSVNDRLKALVPGIERRAGRYTPLISRSVSGLVWAAALLLTLDAWGLPTIEALFSAAGVSLLASLAGILITVAVLTLFIEAAHVTVEYFLSGRRGEDGEPIEPTAHQRTLLPLGYSAVKWIAISVGAILILDILGVNIAPILAGAGILGLAIGFGAQSLVKDIITGVFMLIENNIAIGDIVRVKDIAGTVEGFNLRSVRLRDYSGNVHVIPNSSIEVVTNFTKEFSRAVFDIGVAYRENVDRVIQVIREVGDGMYEDPEWGEQILEPVEIAGVNSFDESSVTIRGRFKTKPIMQWGVRREFYRRIKQAFDERGIEIPFPYRTLTWAEPAPEIPEAEMEKIRAARERRGIPDSGGGG